ncbi:Hypothetical_protein [Hexamita inflata]|uniref:Hypothetical_protein n=1 Tax=Hexamita inflata TaxID=28002 RepID=A0AA86RAR9_9EUKA|nr:Hypothetical protein HINF_LOCUS56769 [Hexamita inflata]
MSSQQVLAQALMRTQQRLDDEMNSINVFNTNPKLLQLQSVLADLKQKQQQFQRIANDKQAHSKFANSEQDRAQQIALLNENTVEFNQKSDELAQYHAALQIPMMTVSLFCTFPELYFILNLLLFIHFSTRQRAPLGTFYTWSFITLLKQNVFI